MIGPDFSYYPLSQVVEHVRGEVDHSRGYTRWRVDYDGILHVTHDPQEAGADIQPMAFRLVPVRQEWVEVDES